jgi:intracellular sulfur oxidation DsrE/DsrF family protein
MKHIALCLATISMLAIPCAQPADPPGAAPALIPGALPYVPIAGAKAAPDGSHVYKVIFNVTRAATRPEQPVDGILFAATDLSALRGQGVPATNTRFALILHDSAVDGILDNGSYRAKFGVDNPNLGMLSALRQAGVEIMVCGQFLGAMQIDPRTLSPDVSIASEAFLTLITYQNNGYAVLEF